MPELTRHSLRLVINDCWWLFALVWFVGSLATKKTERTWRAGLQLAYWAVLAVSMALLFGLQGSFGYLYAGGRGSWVAGAGLAVAGVAVAVWARVSLASNWSGAVMLKEEHELIEKGPYRWVRHPIYTGLILMVLGTAVFSGSVSAALGFALFFLAHLWKLRLEEDLLTGRFPQAYPAYKARTWALFPGLF